MPHFSSCWELQQQQLYNVVILEHALSLSNISILCTVGWIKTQDAAVNIYSVQPPGAYAVPCSHYCRQGEAQAKSDVVKGGRWGGMFEGVPDGHPQ